MPFHLPHLGGHHHSSDSGKESPPPKFIPVSPNAVRRENTYASAASGSSASGSATPSNSSSQPPASILKKNHPHANRHSSDYTTSSASGSAFLSKRLSTGLSFDRTETIESTRSSFDGDGDDDDTSGVTPGTSVSSFGNSCPLPPSSASQKFPFFVMTLSSTSTLSFMALPLAMRPIVLDAVNRAWRRGVSKTGQIEYQPELMKRHKEKGCEGGVWEVTLKDNCWLPKTEDKVASKRILINLLTAFAKEGYSLTSSFRTSAKDSGKDTLIFLRGEPDPDPVFFAVAFYSSDRIWIIDAEADVGEALETGITQHWIDGIRDARVRERHCREIRLRGNPWTAHSASALISARCIHLVIMKIITHCDRGYDFVGSVDMADLDEGEMPVTFYRKKWGPERAVWDMPA